MIGINLDDYFMRQALQQAKQAFDEDEVPVGAVVVFEQQIIAKAYNQTERLNDATAHAEMLAITSAANYVGSKYLNQCTLYVTLEPCSMCGGALHWSQLGKVVYGANDDRKGFSQFVPNLLHPRTEIVSGVLAFESQTLLQLFFKAKRN